MIITYYWPPSGGAGVQRWLKFSKYLPGYGWEPVILTVDPLFASYPQQDRGLLEEVSPSLRVIKTKASKGIFSAYRIVTGRKEIPYGGFANEDNPGFLQILSRFIRGNFVLPDARKGWNKYAYAAANEIILKENIQVVITTSPPHSTQLTGLKLKKKLNIKWIADLRDPWSDIYYSDRMYQTGIAKRINRSMEERVLNTADRIITTCNTTLNLFRSKLDKDLAPEKVITVTNGYDPDDFKYGDIRPRDFTITYLGTFSGCYDAGVLAEAISYCEERNITEITLRFIGKTDNKVEKIFKDKKNVKLEILTYVDHSKAVEYLARSAALLLVVPSDKKEAEMIPGKLFEYLAAKRPVIALAPKESDVADILLKTNGGMIFTRNDSVKLGEYLMLINENLKNGIFETGASGIEEYTRHNLSGKIAAVLNSLQ